MGASSASYISSTSRIGILETTGAGSESPAVAQAHEMTCGYFETQDIGIDREHLPLDHTHPLAQNCAMASSDEGRGSPIDCQNNGSIRKAAHPSGQ
jgi:hypothetical protein